MSSADETKKKKGTLTATAAVAAAPADASAATVENVTAPSKAKQKAKTKTNQTGEGKGSAATPTVRKGKKKKEDGANAKGDEAKKAKGNKTETLEKTDGETTHNDRGKEADHVAETTTPSGPTNGVSEDDEGGVIGVSASSPAKKKKKTQSSTNGSTASAPANSKIMTGESAGSGSVRAGVASPLKEVTAPVVEKRKPTGPSLDGHRVAEALTRLLQRKEGLERKLVELEFNIYNFEGSYLEDQGGNFIFGAEGGGGGGGSGVGYGGMAGERRRWRGVSDHDRLFSQSSTTYQQAIEAHEIALRSEHPRGLSGEPPSEDEASPSVSASSAAATQRYKKRLKLKHTGNVSGGITASEVGEASE